MSRFGYLLTASLVVVAASAASAETGSWTASTPGGRPVTLSVRDSGELRCLWIAVGDEGPRRTSPCATPPKDAHDDARGLHVVYRGAPEKVAIIHGLASDQTAVLRVRLGDGRLLDIRPQRGGYLHVIPGRPAVATVNALGPQDDLRGAADPDPRAVKPLRGPFSLARTRDERGSRATVTAFAARLYEARTTRRPVHACMAVTGPGSPGAGVEPGYSGGSACTTSPRRIVLRFTADCGSDRVLLYGLAPKAVRRLTVITASGARIPASTAGFPRAMRWAGRAFVVSRPEPGRLVRLEAYGSTGARLASLPIPAAGSGCGSSERS